MNQFVHTGEIKLTSWSHNAGVIIRFPLLVVLTTMNNYRSWDANMRIVDTPSEETISIYNASRKDSMLYQSPVHKQEFYTAAICHIALICLPVKTKWSLTKICFKKWNKKLPRLAASRKRRRPTGRVHLSAYIKKRKWGGQCRNIRECSAEKY